MKNMYSLVKDNRKANSNNFCLKYPLPLIFFFFETFKVGCRPPPHFATLSVDYNNRKNKKKKRKKEKERKKLFIYITDLQISISWSNYVYLINPEFWNR